MEKNKTLINWLYFCCFMVFAMAVIGAITRLTESGLSIVEWRPLIGAIPPLSEEEWNRVYSLYKQTPEYHHKHNWMELDDFKSIYFWEWFHRLWGRLIGVVYFLPLIYFWIKNKIPNGYKKPFIFILTLGFLQGFLGWYMVKSGLVNEPSVSHFRLASHLTLALIIYSLLWWFALSLKHNKVQISVSARSRAKYGWYLLALLFITIVWGAFTAGKDAGVIYNSFPLMNHSFLPQEAFYLSALYNEQAWIQFVHRWLAIATALLIIVYAIKHKNALLACIVLIQVGLGVSTLLSQVNITLAAFHQAGAIILLSALIAQIFRLSLEASKED
jgi:cytochrome c oxidase assembly protein subunit 15